MSNYKRNVFYTGVTNRLIRRIIEHQNGLGSAFTSKYNLKYLIFFEEYGDIARALFREKQIKGWKRSKKISLIKSENSTMKDLSEQLFKGYGVDNVDIKKYVEELRKIRKIK